MTYVWKIMLREIEDNPLEEDFKELVVLAETFDEAIAKTKAYIKKTWSETSLEISSCKKLFEVDLE